MLQVGVHRIRAAAEVRVVRDEELRLMPQPLGVGDLQEVVRPEAVQLRVRLPRRLQPFLQLRHLPETAAAAKQGGNDEADDKEETIRPTSVE